MTDKNFPIGATLKRIRGNKRYTQKQISDATMARSTYTKFEKGVITPTLAKYLAILDHMDMTHEEFIYIANDYAMDEKGVIQYLFQQLEWQFKSEIVDEIIERGESLLRDRYDQLTQDIVNACFGYKALSEERDLEKAQSFAGKIWHRLESLDKYYLAELHLLNSILYLFDSETASSLTNRALSDLARYKANEEAEALQMSFLLHVTNRLLLEEKYVEALPYIEQMEACDNIKHPLLWATALIRKEVCLKKMDSTTELGLIDKAIRVFESLEKVELVEWVKRNPETFWNVYAVEK